MISFGLPRFTGSEKSVLEQADDAFDQVRDVAEAASLLALAVDRDRLAPERLLHEVGKDAAVVQAHPRAVGVEDAHDSRLDAVIAVIGHRDGLGEPLGLVVAAAGTDRD